MAISDYLFGLMGIVLAIPLISFARRLSNRSYYAIYVLMLALSLGSVFAWYQWEDAYPFLQGVLWLLASATFVLSVYNLFRPNKNIYIILISIIYFFPFLFFLYTLIQPDLPAQL